jgi:hypothetical protein
MRFGSSRAMERRVRRRRSGWVQADDAALFLLRPGRQRRLRRMLPAPVTYELRLVASERRRGKGPRGRNGVRAAAAAVRRFLIQSGKNQGRGGERVQRHCASGVGDGVTGGAVSAAVAFEWQRDFRAPSKSGLAAIFLEAC